MFLLSDRVSFFLLVLGATICDGGLFGGMVQFAAAEQTESESPELDSLGVPTARLSNNRTFPLIGIEVGNVPNDLVAQMIAFGLQDNLKIRLIDTAHASTNDIVAEGITRGAQQLAGDSDRKVEVHLVAKVWHTHLGYERTKLSVRKTINDFSSAIEHKNVDLRLHFLINWPRCYDNIDWMNCEEEENKLSEEVKNASPAPHLDKDNAWKESWKALEDMYESDEFPDIASIGVANFRLQDMEQFESFARVKPHILLINVWSILFDPYLVHWCHSHDVHMVVYDVIDGVVGRWQTAPHAIHHVQKIAKDVSRSQNLEDDFTPAQMVLVWLAQHGMSVVPATTRPDHFEENSAVGLSEIPEFTDEQYEGLGKAIEALLSGQDIEEDFHVKAHFHAVSKNMFLFWVNHDGDMIQLASIHKGNSFEETTFPGHSYRAYDHEDADHYIEYKIQANYGEQEHFHVEL